MGINPAVRAERCEALITTILLVLLYRKMAIGVDDQFSLKNVVLSARCHKMAVVIAALLWNRCCKASHLTLFAGFNKLSAVFFVFL